MLCIEMPAQQTDDGSTLIEVSSVIADSFIIESDANYGRYHPVRAFDGDPCTAWNEGAQGPGIGQKIAISFWPAITVDSIAVMPGYFDPQWFMANNRIKKAALTFMVWEKNTRKVVFTTVVKFEDGMISRTVDPGSMITFDTFKLEILEVYKGDLYDDTCISEIVFYLNGKQLVPDLEYNLAWIAAREKIAVEGFHSPAGFSFGFLGPMNVGTFRLFFPDGTFLMFYTGGHPNTMFGRWKLLPDGRTIEIRLDFFHGLEPVGAGISPGFSTAPAFKEYKYYEKDVDITETFDWLKYYQEMQVLQRDRDDKILPIGIYPLTSRDYRLLNRGYTAEMRAYVEAEKKRYYELGGK